MAKTKLHVFASHHFFFLRFDFLFLILCLMACAPMSPEQKVNEKIDYIYTDAIGRAHSRMNTWLTCISAIMDPGGGALGLGEPRTGLDLMRQNKHQSVPKFTSSRQSLTYLKFSSFLVSRLQSQHFGWQRAIHRDRYSCERGCE